MQLHVLAEVLTMQQGHAQTDTQAMPQVLPWSAAVKQQQQQQQSVKHGAWLSREQHSTVQRSPWRQCSRPLVGVDSTQLSTAQHRHDGVMLNLLQSLAYQHSTAQHSTKNTALPSEQCHT